MDATNDWLERTQWFRDAKFGMFIHWGLYAIPARGEWTQYHERIPADIYANLIHAFNPVDFDADAWVALAKRAGQRYVCVTSKHHEGFCLFDSALTDFKATNSPGGRDYIRDLTEACHRADMPIFYYYSLPDWHHPDAREFSERFDFRFGRPPGQWERYVAYIHGQIRELCTNYGQIAGIWFDMGLHRSPEDWGAEALCAMIRELQPHALINNRTGLPMDYGTPEQYVPVTPQRGGASHGEFDGQDETAWPPPVSRETFFEVCHTMVTGGHGSWGYLAKPRSFHSAERLIRILADTVGKGGNLLLNVGPRPDGTIQPEFVERLEAIGDWLTVNGEAVYGASAGPVAPSLNMTSTRRAGKVYVFCFDWPVPRGVDEQVTSAAVLGSDAPAGVRQEGAALHLDLPADPPDRAAGVVALDVGGEQPRP